MSAPDREAMAAAIADFLRAAGLDPEHGELVGTPVRVARAWADEWLGKPHPDPKALLGTLPPATDPGTGDARELVIFTGITFTSVCPHHLLPYPGKAHLAYRPGAHLAGFGELTRLVRGLASQLILQEALGAKIADALRSVLDAAGTACVIDGWPMCVATRGARDPGSRVRTVARRGTLADDHSPDLALFLAALPGPRAGDAP